jgi:hypothetical protein
MEQSSTYVYKDPCQEGYVRCYMSKKEYNKLFPHYKLNWASYNEYYVSDTKILIQRFTEPFAKVIVTLLMPINIFMYGWIECKRDLKRFWWEKKFGAFSSQGFWKDGIESDVKRYSELVSILKTK